MATIKIQRKDEYVNRIRDYRFYVDGRQIGTIANGQTKDFEVTSGRHSIIAKIDWCSSPELSFDLKENETKSFSVGGFKNSNWIILLSVVIGGLFLYLNYTGGMQNPIILILPLAFALLLIYYVTVGRKNYLILTELKAS